MKLRRVPQNKGVLSIELVLQSCGVRMIPQSFGSGREGSIECELPHWDGQIDVWRCSGLQTGYRRGLDCLTICRLSIPEWRIVNNPESETPDKPPTPKQQDPGKCRLIAISSF